MSDIYLLLGTNLGDREYNLQIAKEQITAHQLTIKKESAIYETAAWGIEDQPSFLNQVVIVESDKNPERILIIINIIEGLMGRVRNMKWAQRLIDIDILYYGDAVVDKPRLKIPHPEIQNRRFTLTPLVELASDFKHPINGKTQLEMLEACQDKLKAKIFLAEL
ncbi:2-amino-4-hydroxy-6-hydroxymethyldihydropteridine diphosphokinase [Roseivirga echinicomitans]|uniref:2-amino-4-hydroxy-6-hydroxymethyldihydropteridine pyrophosphokinase n=1 Tax=Roseivirga echinicomitans TaxID=296218 RepID=A0A150XJ05_9BACT|nr:2-amino-4-hydroxy-6-hydroxymethyldihydropteridine diphosphokinase [Roseivirga echinicomitans]KYG78718.1 2-amino-4-hydroxy-6-hydroxymethyldihydropteridine pyrophosphokinase [Roseivirga echinicomitans]